MEFYKNHIFSIEIKEAHALVEIHKEFMDFEDVDAMIIKHHEMLNGRVFPLILDFCNMKAASPKSRTRMAANDAEKGINAVAVVARSKIHKIIYNLYTIKNKKRIPIKMFDTYVKAHQWIENFKPEI